MSNYKSHNDKFINVTEDGLRVNLYKSGIVTSQQPGQSHSEYASKISNNFSNLSQSEMSDYTFSLFRKK